VQMARWSRPGWFVVADTTVFIEHESKLEDLNLPEILGVGNARPVHLLVPMVVMDELDGLKNRASKPHARWRAGHALAVFDRLFDHGTEQALLRRGEPPAPSSGVLGRPETTVEILFDPPGHVRLPLAKDELVDRAVAIQALAGRIVTLLTFDTSQSMRARAAGLGVLKFPKPIGDEPQRR
jgi:predicted ribonuclease YlaK